MSLSNKMVNHAKKHIEYIKELVHNQPVIENMNYVLQVIEELEYDLKEVYTHIANDYDYEDLDYGIPCCVFCEAYAHRSETKADIVHESTCIVNKALRKVNEQKTI